MGKKTVSDEKLLELLLIRGSVSGAEAAERGFPKPLRPNAGNSAFIGGGEHERRNRRRCGDAPGSRERFRNGRRNARGGL